MSLTHDEIVWVVAELQELLASTRLQKVWDVGIGQEQASHESSELETEPPSNADSGSTPRAEQGLVFSLRKPGHAFLLFVGLDTVAFILEHLENRYRRSCQGCASWAIHHESIGSGHGWGDGCRPLGGNIPDALIEGC